MSTLSQTSPRTLRELRNKLAMLRIYQARRESRLQHAYFVPRHPAFLSFFQLLDEHDWFSDDYRWCHAEYQGDMATYEKAIDEANAYWAPKTVVCRQPTYKEALQCARFVYRCSRVMDGSPWPRALSMGVVQWIMDGILAGPAEDSISHCRESANAAQLPA